MKEYFLVLVPASPAGFALLTPCPYCESSCTCLIGQITVAITEKMALSVKAFEPCISSSSSPGDFAGSHDGRRAAGSDTEISG